MMALMDHAPYDFIINHQKSDLERFEGFVHRTFNADDLRYFIKALQHIYQEHQGLEQLFSQYANPESLQGAIHHSKQVFSLPHQQRTQKHVSDPLKVLLQNGSICICAGWYDQVKTTSILGCGNYIHDNCHP